MEESLLKDISYKWKINILNIIIDINDNVMIF